MRPSTAHAGDRSRERERRLVLASQQGDERAEHRLFRAYERVFSSLALTWTAPGLEAGDLVQVARVAFWRAIREWDVQREASFETFARLCIRRDLLDAVRSARRTKNAIVTESQSLSHAEPLRSASSGGDDHGSIPVELLAARARHAHDPLETALVRERLHEILLKLPSLTDAERRAVGMVADGYSRREVADALGSTPKRVDNALQRGRGKLAAAA